MALPDPFSAPKMGSERPRVAPPSPLRHLADEYSADAVKIGYTPFPWQRCALTYLTALGPDDLWMYPEVAYIVSRQNGKTSLLVPLIVKRLRQGRRIMHTAQNRELPREVHSVVADVFERFYSSELKRKPRYANGQEEIRLKNGGIYRIVAPTRSGARGATNDDVIVDELRDMNDFEFISAAEPTLAASSNPQMIYLSNAGTDDSRVLNAIRDRAADDPSLAYLEWSAAPERATGDQVGWLEANPSIGHLPSLWTYLERKHESYRLAGELGIFETEHLCRWVTHILPPIIERTTWDALKGETVPHVRPALGVSMDPNGHRASAVIAWQMEDGRVAVRLLADVTGDPIDVDLFGQDLKDAARLARVFQVGYDGATDAEFAKFFKKPEAITGAKFTNASSLFVNRVESAGIVWSSDSERIGEDIDWTGRKTHQQPGTWTAIPLSSERPVTAMLATIRAVWLASGPKRSKGKVH